MEIKKIALVLVDISFSLAPLWRRLTGKRQEFRHLPH